MTTAHLNDDELRQHVGRAILDKCATALERHASANELESVAAAYRDACAGLDDEDGDDDYPGVPDIVPPHFQPTPNPYATR